MEFSWYKVGIYYKHVHEIYTDFYCCKNENFSKEKSCYFLIFSQNIDSGYTLELPLQDCSNEYPQSMYWNKNKKIMYTLSLVNAS